MILPSLLQKKCVIISVTLKRKGKVDQKTLDVEGRRKNARNAYEFLPEAGELIQGRSVFIVDDVITTGSTVISCAELLLENGADKVVAVSVGRKT